MGFGGGYGNGCGWWWLVAVSWVGFCNWFQFVSQWVSVDFNVFCNGFRWAVVVGWVSDGGGGLGFLMMVVIGGGHEWWLGCFCLGEEIHKERERKRCRE